MRLMLKKALLFFFLGVGVYVTAWAQSSLQIIKDVAIDVSPVAPTVMLTRAQGNGYIVAANWYTGVKGAALWVGKFSHDLERQWKTTVVPGNKFSSYKVLLVTESPDANVMALTDELVQNDPTNKALLQHALTLFKFDGRTGREIWRKSYDSCKGVPDCAFFIVASSGDGINNRGSAAFTNNGILVEAGLVIRPNGPAAPKKEQIKQAIQRFDWDGSVHSEKIYLIDGNKRVSLIGAEGQAWLVIGNKQERIVTLEKYSASDASEKKLATLPWRDDIKMSPYKKRNEFGLIIGSSWDLIKHPDKSRENGFYQIDADMNFHARYEELPYQGFYKAIPADKGGWFSITCRSKPRLFGSESCRGAVVFWPGPGEAEETLYLGDHVFATLDMLETGEPNQYLVVYGSDNIHLAIIELKQ